MSYPEAIQFLYSLQMFGAHFGLERVRQLAALAGDPQKQLRFIHVAGTNGKGSTCAMLESIYRAAGLRVGLFTSPHLVSFRERMQVNRRLISAADVARLVAEVQPLLQQFPADAHPTMFEVVTVMALKYFAEHQCDLVVWETGLGGRLDATNIVTPLVSVITNISRDHTQWLGDTLEKIAAEKAGIIKPGVPVITGAEQPEVLAVIQRVAGDNGAPLTRIQNLDFRPHNAQLPLLGVHQQQNAALALATVQVLQPQIPVAGEQVRGGLAGASWPGRLQFIECAARKFLLDGAHNLAGVETLQAALQARDRANSPPDQITLILGILGDKDWPAMCGRLAPLASQVLLVPVGSERTTQPAQLAEVCRAANPAAQVSCCASLPDALRLSSQAPFTVIAGSLYLVGEALALLDPAFAGAGDERALNDWKPAAR